MKYLKCTLFVALVALVSSCESDYLEPVPTSAISSANYYTTPEEVETAVLNIYDGIQGVFDFGMDENRALQLEFYLTEMRSDNTRTKSSEGEAAQFESFAVEATNGIVANYYQSYYNVIYRANVALENITAAGDMADKLEAEAKFLRAYAYFNLVRLFGDIPLVDRIISPADKATPYARVSTSQIYDLIVSDLTVAAAGLDNSSSYRASKAAAQTLLAKVHLNKGNYLEAQQLCEAVVGSGNYSLEANFKDVFYNEGNDEVIFAVGYIGDSDESQNFSSEFLNAVGRTSGVNYVTQDAKAALDAKGGERTMYSYRIDSGQTTQNQVAKYIPNGDAALGIEATSSDPQKAGNDWVVLRYADVLLLHVEAILAGGNSTSSAAALSSFNAVRNRAGLADDSDSSITKQELMDERRVELAFENHRLFDLMRMGAAQEVLSAFATSTGVSFTSSDLLLPIPQREINLSGGEMKQNPGY